MELELNDFKSVISHPAYSSKVSSVPEDFKLFAVRSFINGNESEFLDFLEELRQRDEVAYAVMLSIWSECFKVVESIEFDEKVVDFIRKNRDLVLHAQYDGISYPDKRAVVAEVLRGNADVVFASEPGKLFFSRAVSDVLSI